MKKITLLTIILLITGCGTMPTSENDLQTTGNLIKICSQISPNKTYKLILREMKECYVPESDLTMLVNGVLMSLKSNTYIDYRKNSNDSYEISLSNQAGLAPRTYGELIKITPGTSSCPTQLNVWVMNSFWNRHANRLKAWLNGKKVDCT
jgi:hypothetical protein